MSKKILSTPKRKNLTKKVRFEVFKRDGFKCQYCGASPLENLLQVDHIIAVKNGGDNCIDNLITSCQPCNIGKGATPLTSIPESMKAKAKRIRDNEEQIQLYNQIIMQKRARIEREVWLVIAEMTDAEEFRRDWIKSIEKFVNQLGVTECLDAMSIASSRFADEYKIFRYFCGICWNKIREKDNG